MNPHLLRTFVAVARHGSFSAAARELGYTQSAVSQHIAALEGDLGVVLLHRRPVGPTEAGARLLEHADSLLLRLDAVRADITRVSGGQAGSLSIGVSPLAVTKRFAEDLSEVRQQNPRLTVAVRVLGREAVVTAVATGAIGLGLVDGMAAPNDPLHLPDLGPLTTVAVADEPLAVALPGDHPLAWRTGLRLNDLVDARWIEAPDTAMPLASLRAATGSAGFRASVRYEGSDVRGLIMMVAAGHGLALLPGSAIGDAVAAVPITVPRLVHRTELLYWGTLTAAAQTFADRCEKVVSYDFPS